MPIDSLMTDECVQNKEYLTKINLIHRNSMALF